MRSLDGARKIGGVLSLRATAALVGTALMVSAHASAPADPRRQIAQDVLASIDASARYLFHMHGTVVEIQGDNAVSGLGRYRYAWTLEALADRGFVVIGEVRRPTDILAYARLVAGQVAKLRAAGVPSEHITVTGMSKGGAIAVLTTAAIGDPAVPFVIMAGCGFSGRIMAAGLQALGRRPQGRVLSIYDRSDGYAAPCGRYFPEAAGLTFKEMVLDTGRGHALFYQPERVWLDLVVDWALGR